MSTYAPHPAAALFPMLGDAELKELADDIRVNGQRDPVTTWHGMVLDGRNRLAACELASIEPVIHDTMTVATEQEAVAFVISKNLRRRNLTPSQSAMIAGQLANLPRGANQHGVEGPSNDGSSPMSVKEAAKALGVSETSVERAKAVAVQSPDLAKEVVEGKKKLGTAHREMKERQGKVKPKKPAPVKPAPTPKSQTTLEPEGAPTAQEIRKAIVRIKRFGRNFGRAFSVTTKSLGYLCPRERSCIITHWVSSMDALSIRLIQRCIGELRPVAETDETEAQPAAETAAETEGKSQ